MRDHGGFEGFEGDALTVFADVDTRKLPLADCVEFLDNLRKPITQEDREPGPYPYYGANGQQDSVAEFIFDEELLLLAEDGGHFGSADKDIAYLVSGKCWVNNHAHVLRAKPGTELRYLYHAIRKFDVLPFISGSTRGKLTKGAAERIPILLPTIPEQRRIADILDRADALKRKRQQALKLADDFLRATFLDMFGDLGRYSAVMLKDLAVEDGIKCGPFGTQLQRSEFCSEGVPLWGIKQLNKQFKKPTHEFVSKAKAQELSAYSIKPGDLVMTRKGDVGKCAIYPELLEDGVMHSDLVRLRLNQEICDPYYLLFLLHHSAEFAKSLDSISQGAVMAGVNVTKLKSLSIRNAPIELQINFREIVGKTSAILDRIQLFDFQVGELGKSLASSAFKAKEASH